MFNVAKKLSFDLWISIKNMFRLTVWSSKLNTIFQRFTAHFCIRVYSNVCILFRVFYHMNALQSEIGSFHHDTKKHWKNIHTRSNSNSRHFNNKIVKKQTIWKNNLLSCSCVRNEVVMACLIFFSLFCSGLCRAVNYADNANSFILSLWCLVL